MLHLWVDPLYRHNVSSAVVENGVTPQFPPTQRQPRAVHDQRPP